MSTASFFRHVIIIAFTLTIALLYTFVTFRGISTADGMEKSQLAREIARGSYQTKVIRPISVWQVSDKKETTASLNEVGKADTYNSPLYPILLGIIFKATGVHDFEKWEMQEGDMVYTPDRIVAAVSILFFVLTLLIVYALARSIFDSTVAGVAVVITVTCDLLWKFTQTGMPNCLMLLFFSAACFFIYKASVKTAQESTGYVSGVLAGISLILLSLTHWMAVWILVGYLVYSFFFLRPKGLISASTAVLALIAFAPSLLNNFQQTGNPFGTAFFTIYNGLGVSSERIMRSTDIGDINIPIRDVAFTFVRNSIKQITRVYEYSGLMITAPLFFLALIHQYKNAAADRFKWALLTMWIFGSIGMSIYGMGDNALSPSQMHFLFAPLMTIFGISIVMILWQRFKTTSSVDGMWGNLPLIVISLLAALPMMLSLPNDIYTGLVLKKSFPNWPPYIPSTLNRAIHKITPDQQYVLSDQPWAVSWYADRSAVWLPTKVDAIKEIEDTANRHNTPIYGIHISPLSLGEGQFYSHFMKNRDIGALALDGWAGIASGSNGRLGAFVNSSPDLAPLMKRYPYPIPLSGFLTAYYVSTIPE